MQLVKLKAPMKEIMWMEGEWSNESDNWSQELRNHLKVPPINNSGDCYFWMTIEELRYQF